MFLSILLIAIMYMMLNPKIKKDISYVLNYDITR